MKAVFAALAGERLAASNSVANLEQRPHEMEIADTEKPRLRKQHAQNVMVFLRDRRRPMFEAYFEMVTVIGKSAFCGRHTYATLHEEKPLRDEESAQSVHSAKGTGQLYMVGESRYLRC